MLAIQKKLLNALYLSIYLLVVAGVFFKGIPFWETANIDLFSGSQSGFETIHDAQLLTAFFAISSVVLIGMSFSIVMALFTALHLRRFPSAIRRRFTVPFQLLGIVPVFFWILLLNYTAAGTQLLTGANSWIAASSAIAIGGYPMLVLLLFRHINNIPDDLIDVGYGLGANNTQIALRVILPEVRSELLFSILLTFIRLILELSMILIATQAVDLEAISKIIIGIILIMIIIAVTFFNINLQPSR